MSEKIKYPENEALSLAEKATVAKLRGIQDGDVGFIALWNMDPETHNHLKYLPEPPSNPDGDEDYLDLFRKYYNNQGEPEKITPLVAINCVQRPISALVIRWRGNPDLPRISGKTASIESFVVDPELRNKGIGKRILAGALRMIFDEYKGYGEEGAKEVRAWIFTDSQAGDFKPNMDLFRRMGFEVMAGNYREYAKKRNIPNPDNRDAQLYHLTRAKYEEMKQENPDLFRNPPIDLLSLRV